MKSFEERREYCKRLVKISEFKVNTAISFHKFNKKYFIPFVYFNKEAILFDIFYENDSKPSSAFEDENDWITHTILHSNHNFRKVVLNVNQHSLVPVFSFSTNVNQIVDDKHTLQLLKRHFCKLDSISAQRFYFAYNGLNVQKIELNLSDIECVLPIRKKISFEKEKYAEFAFKASTTKLTLCIENIECFDSFDCIAYEIVPALPEGQRLLLYSYDNQNNKLLFCNQLNPINVVKKGIHGLPIYSETLAKPPAPDSLYYLEIFGLVITDNSVSNFSINI